MLDRPVHRKPEFRQDRRCKGQYRSLKHKRPEELDNSTIYNSILVDYLSLNLF